VYQITKKAGGFHDAVDRLVWRVFRRPPLFEVVVFDTTDVRFAAIAAQSQPRDSILMVITFSASYITLPGEQYH